MSVRNGLLAILADQPAHGYALKSRFEKETADAWPLNVGQVYTTLARLERDGLVRSVSPDAIDRQTWAITPDGREALESWRRTPVHDRPLRDELALKVLLAVAAEGVDVRPILQSQRSAATERLMGYTRHKRASDPERSLARTLLLDALIIKAEAEIKWLDLCEDRLRQRRTGRRA
jgi:DNA-binding PadR family transcriptional regulator